MCEYVAPYSVHTLKDVAPRDFIIAFAKHLKTQGKVEIPKVRAELTRINLLVSSLFSGLSTTKLADTRSFRRLTKTGFTFVLLLSFARFTSGLTSVLRL